MSERDITKLPKWAQGRIKTLERQAEDCRRTMRTVLETQQTRKEWHEHEFFTEEHVDGELIKRFFVTSDMQMRTDSGIEVNILCGNNGEVKIFFDANRRTLAEKGIKNGDVAVIPVAQNLIELHLVEKVKK